MSSIPGSTVLVTGGAGYVGSMVVEELLARGRRVRAFDALLHGDVPSLLLRWGYDAFEFLRGDARDPATRLAALEGVQAVVHLAAIVGDPACARQPEEAWSVNYGATLALLDDAQAAGVERLVFASTCSNYGKMAAGPAAFASEEWELRPVSLYAETKVAAELEVLARTKPGFATSCLRFATVYGTSGRMRFDLTVNEFTRDMLLSGGLVVYGERFWRPYVHVRDAAAAVCALLEARREAIAGEVFNVGSTAENYRKLDLVDLLKKRIPDGNVDFVETGEDPRDYRVNFSKIESVLGFRTRRTVPDGIDEVIRLLESGLVADPFAAMYRN